MALAQTCTTLSPSFITELLPSAQRVALLYNVSYLCLANFPKLERLLRERAMETQILFGSSEVILLKCVLTSENLVRHLLPMLAVSVEKNVAVLAVKYLEKAKRWINDIINDVEDITKKYEEHCKDVSTTASDVITEKDNVDKEKEKLSKERKAIQESLEKYKKDLKQVNDELSKIEQDLITKTNELSQHVQDVTAKDTGLGILSAILPFAGHIIHAIYNASTSPAAVAKTKELETEINRLTAEKTSLRHREWNIQIEVINWQMQDTKASMELGSIPSPEHLPEVQAHLTKICNILLALLQFWKRVDTMLDSLHQKTFVNENLIEFLDLMKEDFLTSITEAKKGWKVFGEACAKANGVFSVQTKDAYQFLEVNTSSLSKEAWQAAHDAVMEKLKQIEPSSTPALPPPTEEQPTDP